MDDVDGFPAGPNDDGEDDHNKDTDDNGSNNNDGGGSISKDDDELRLMDGAELTSYQVSCSAPNTNYVAIVSVSQVCSYNIWVLNRSFRLVLYAVFITPFTLFSPPFRLSRRPPTRTRTSCRIAPLTSSPSKRQWRTA